MWKPALIPAFLSVSNSALSVGEKSSLGLL
jgi:hypothetical protein